MSEDTPSEPVIFKFLGIGLILAVFEKLFVHVTKIDEATLIFIGPVRTTVYTVLVLVTFGFIMRFLLRPDPRDDYQKPSEFLAKEPIIK